VGNTTSDVITVETSDRDRKRALTRIIQGALVAAALIAAATLPSTAGAASKRCGSVGSGYERLHVQVVSGSTSCRTARRVMRIAVHNGGAHIGKWTCDGGAGGIGCARRMPRARIVGTV
jgi:hypothetical protein